MSRLNDLYKKEIKDSVFKKFGYKNANMIPKLEKIVVNCCSRDCLVNGKTIDFITADLTAITGQKPIKTKARKSVSQFKLREGQILGASVTLRGNMMYEFLDRLMNITLPRVRDFRGVSKKAFDGRGNYTLGIKEQTIFPEIDYDKIDKPRGVGITIVTSAKTNEESKELLTQFGMPFKK